MSGWREAGNWKNQGLKAPAKRNSEDERSFCVPAGKQYLQNIESIAQCPLPFKSIIIFRLPIEIVAEPLKQYIWKKVLQYGFKSCYIDYSVYSTQLIYIYIDSKICCLATFTAEVIWWRPPSSLSRRPNRNFGAVSGKHQGRWSQKPTSSSSYQVPTKLALSFLSGRLFPSLLVWLCTTPISTFTWISPIPKAVIYSHNST